MFTNFCMVGLAVGLVGFAGLDVWASPVGGGPIRPLPNLTSLVTADANRLDTFAMLQPRFNPSSNPFFKTHDAQFLHPGEHIDYDIVFWGIRVGNMSLSILPTAVLNDRLTYHFRAESRLTFWFLDGLYRVRSLVDAESFKPLDLRMEKLSNQGSVSRFLVHEVYDWFNLQTDYVQKYNKKESQDVFPIRNFSQNSLSTFYFLRTLPLRVGETYRFPATTKSRNMVARLEVLKRETLRLRGLGERRTLKVRLHTVLWHLSTPRVYTIMLWLSDDSYKHMLKSKSHGLTITAHSLRRT